MLKNLGAPALCLISLLPATLTAQNVFVLPGANNPGSNVQVYSTPLTSLNSFAAGFAASRVFPRPDGTKFFILAASGSQTVTAVDPGFAHPRSLGNLGTAATAAALTPDGKRLLVAAGSLHVYDTTTEADLIPAGILPGTIITDVAVSLDGSRAFVIGLPAAGGSAIYAVDLSTFNVIGNVPVLGQASSVAVGPNGLVYAATRNLVLEINPSTVAVTQNGQVSINADPGRPAFTSDGRYLVYPNRTPITGGSSVVIDLTTHTYSAPTGQANGGLANIVFDRILPLNPTTAFAYSAQANTLYTLSIPSLQIGTTSFTGIQAVSVTAVALSNDVAAGSKTLPQTLYALAGGNLVQVDIPSNQATATVATTVQNASALSVAGPFLNNQTPATLLQYGDKQALNPGATSLPLVVQVLDANGLPMFGVPVAFTVSSGAATVQTANAVSGVNGYATTTVVPTANSVITATAGTVSVNFSINAGTSGGGGGPTTGGMSIVGGQGQIIFEYNNTNIPGQGSPFAVLVTDATGSPISGVPVTFTQVSGSGGFTQCATLSSSSDGTSITGNTSDGTQFDCGGVNKLAKGVISVPFQTTAIQPGSGHTPTVIQASAPNTNSVSFYVNTVHQNGFPSPLFPQPQTFTGAAGSTIKAALQVVVVDSLGQKMPNVGIRLIDPDTWNGDPTTAPNSTYASCADSTGVGVLTDANGIGTCDLVFSGKVTNQVQILLNVGSHFAGGPYNLKITTGPPATVGVVQGDKQSGKPGQQLPQAFLVQVTDAGGNLLPGVPVNFTVLTPNTLTLLNQSSATDSNGRASALGVLGPIAGTFQVKITAGAASVNMSYTVTIPATGIQAVSGGNQTGLVNTAFPAPLVVKVVDAGGLGVSGLPVTFQVAGGSATLGTPNATTDANGQAQTTVTAGATPGAITVTATSGSLIPAGFTLSSRLPGPTNISFVNGASFQPGISPGAIATVRGTAIVTKLQGTVQPTNVIGPLPTTLAGATITFNGIAAPILSASNQSGQESVTVQVPFEVTPGSVSVVVTSDTGASATVTTRVDPVSPGIFETVYNGQSYVVATKQFDGSYVTPDNPALRGDVICIYATGLGQTSPATGTNRAGVAGQLVLDPLDTGLNNAGVRMVSAVYQPGSVGVFQVCMQVPADAAPGPRVPVGLIVHDPAGDFFGQSTYVPIQ